MAKRKTSKIQALTIRELQDTVWPMVQTILDENYPPQAKGHRWVTLQRIL